MGSAEFASMVASLLALSQGITIMLSKSLLLFFDYDRPYYSEYAVGFSGVLFGMKVVLNSRSDDYTFVHGVVVPSRYAAWAELILIQMFVPGVSFLGHLGGILAGILYMKLRRHYSGSDPITAFMRGVGGLLNWPLRFLRGLFRFRRGRITGRGTVGGHRTGRGVGGGGQNGGVWRCHACTYDNSGLLSVCEMCGTSRGGNGLASIHWSRDSDGIPLDELRRRRIDRFGGR